MQSGFWLHGQDSAGLELEQKTLGEALQALRIRRQGKCQICKTREDSLGHNWGKLIVEPDEYRNK
jgi:hypothetical protein